MGLGLGIVPLTNKLCGRLAKPLVRAWQTNFYSLGKVALGEPLYPGSDFPRDWIHLDWKDADYRVDLVKTPVLPFRGGSVTLIYSAHLIEHLPEPALAALLRECFRVLEPGGQIRLECPDAEKLVELYRKRDQHMLKHFGRFRRETIVGRHGFDTKYLEDHLSLLGEMSNYIIPGYAFHMPVYAPREQFEEQLERLDLDAFGTWCVSLQTSGTEAERRSSEHSLFLQARRNARGSWIRRHRPRRFRRHDHARAPAE